MTTTSEKITAAITARGLRNQGQIAHCMGWSQPTWYRRKRDNHFEPDELEKLADIINKQYLASINPHAIDYLSRTGELLPDLTAEDLRGDQEPPDVLIINGYRYEKVRE